MRKTGRLAAGVLIALAVVLGAGTGEARAACTLNGGVVSVTATTATVTATLDADGLTVQDGAQSQTCGPKSAIETIDFPAAGQGTTAVIRLATDLTGGPAENDGSPEIEVALDDDYTTVRLQSLANGVNWVAGRPTTGNPRPVRINTNPSASDTDADVSTGCVADCVELWGAPDQVNSIDSRGFGATNDGAAGVELRGGALGDTLRGGNQDDTFIPLAGGDTIATGNGVNQVEAVDGEADSLTCGSDNDTGHRDRVDAANAACEFGVAHVEFDDATITRGEGSGTSNVTLNLSRAIPSASSVKVSSQNQSATAGADYTALPADFRVTIPAHTTAVTFPVSILDDDLHEPGGDETFRLTLSDPSSEIGVGTASQATVSIDENDAVPVVSVDDLALDEGGPAGRVQVKLTRASSQPQSVNLAGVQTPAPALTQDDVPQFDLDQTVTFQPGDVLAQLPVTAVADDVDEEDERLDLELSGESGGIEVGGDDDGRITVVDGTAPPVASVGDAIVVEGGEAQVPVTLVRRSSRPLSINWSVTPGTAGGGDATLDDGRIDFVPGGPTAAMIKITTIADGVFDPDETLNVAIAVRPGSGPLTIGDGAGVITIADPSAEPVLALLDPPGVAEGGDGQTPANPVLRTSSLSGGPITATIQVTGGSAALGSDVSAPPGQVTIPAGVREVPVPVSVLGDTRYEHHEDLIVQVVGAAGAGVGPDPGARVLILDDEEAPAPELGVPAALRLPGAFTPAVSGVADGATLQCSLQKPGDGAPPELGSCPEGLSFGTLDVGRFTLAVRQVDAEGRISPVARATFDVLAALPAPVVTPPPSEFVPGALCGAVSGTLLEAVRSGKRVRLRGLARPRFAGQRVRILAGKRTVAQPTVKPDGTFEATVAAPAAPLTSYTTSLGGSAVVLSKDLRIVSRRRAGGVERIRVAVPKGAARSATISRCAGGPSLGTRRVTPAGTFVLVLAKPRAGEPYAVYRVSVRVGRRTLTMGIAVAR